MRLPQDELAELEQASLLRRIAAADPTLTNFSSNDYLGLTKSRAVIDAFREGLDRFGAGSGASRLICGTHSPHEELEDTIAKFKRTDAALAFSMGAVGDDADPADLGDLALPLPLLLPPPPLACRIWWVDWASAACRLSLSLALSAGLAADQLFMSVDVCCGTCCDACCK